MLRTSVHVKTGGVKPLFLHNPRVTTAQFALGGSESDVAVTGHCQVSGQFAVCDLIS